LQKNELERNFKTKITQFLWNAKANSRGWKNYAYGNYIFQNDMNRVKLLRRKIIYMPDTL